MHRAHELKEMTMSKEIFDRGLAIRKKVLGAEFVEKSFASADDFNQPMQELTTEYCWGADGAAKACRTKFAACSISR
jgi:hypothetical protein